MGLFDSLFGGGQNIQNGSRNRPNQQQNVNYDQLLSQLMSNPYAFARENNLNIPTNIKHPKQMVDYIISSGQMGGWILNEIQNVVSQGR